MYLYLSFVEKKVAEFYHNICVQKALFGQVNLTYFHCFFQTIDGVLTTITTVTTMTTMTAMTTMTTIAKITTVTTMILMTTITTVTTITTLLQLGPVPPMGGRPRIVGPGYISGENIWTFPSVSFFASGAQLEKTSRDEHGSPTDLL